jgi:hypothetical protein
MAHKILLPDKSYSFRSYFKMRWSIVDILQELGVGFGKARIQVPGAAAIDPDRLVALQQRVQATAARVNLASEAARREALIFPVLFEVAELTGAQMEIEYAVEVSRYLYGELDYLLRTSQNAVVVEAKNADLVHGFTQLAVELVALDGWVETDAPMLYGAVTTGDIWQLGAFDRAKRLITQDVELYRVPTDLASLMGSIVAML